MESPAHAKAALELASCGGGGNLLLTQRLGKQYRSIFSQGDDFFKDFFVFQSGAVFLAMLHFAAMVHAICCISELKPQIWEAKSSIFTVGCFRVYLGLV